MKVCDVCGKSGRELDSEAGLTSWTIELRDGYGQLERVATFEACRKCVDGVIRSISSSADSTEGLIRWMA